MEIYWIIVAGVVILGMAMPQSGPERKYYIILMAVLHGFVCGFRYAHLTGDLMKYNWEFLQTADNGWFSESVFHGGRNFGFYFLMKLFCHLTGGNFQVFLLLIAIFTQYAAARVIFRYSAAPWLSYLVYNCMGFYVFGFSAIKQALAMGFVMLSFVGIAEGRPGYFSGMMALAGAVHLPSLVFLPAYWLGRQRFGLGMMGLYAVAALVLYLCKGQIMEIITSLYYGEREPVGTFTGLAGRFFLMLLMIGAGVLLQGVSARRMEILLHLMVISTVIQMFSGFDNLFTRLADFYFQFSVLYIPGLFAQGIGEKSLAGISPVLPFNNRSRRMFAAVFCLFLIWFYDAHGIGVEIANAVDDYTNFRFFWDVK